MLLVTGWHEVLQALSKVQLTLIGLALGLSVCNYLLRYLRWRVYLQHLHAKVPWLEGLAIYIAGFALTATPAKAGEMVRGIFLQKFNVPFSVNVSTFLTERLSDLCAAILLASCGLWFYQGGQALIASTLVLLIISGLALRYLNKSGRLLAWIRQKSWLAPRLIVVRTMLAETRRCHHPRLLVQGLLLGTLAWAVEGYALHVLISAVGYEISVLQSLAIYGTAILAGALTFLPGGILGAEATLLVLLKMSGVELQDAVVIMLLSRLTTLWFSVVLGSCVLLPRLKQYWR